MGHLARHLQKSAADNPFGFTGDYVGPATDLLLKIPKRTFRNLGPGLREFAKWMKAKGSKWLQPFAPRPPLHETRLNPSSPYTLT